MKGNRTDLNSIEHLPTNQITRKTEWRSMCVRMNEYQDSSLHEQRSEEGDDVLMRQHLGQG